VIDRLYVCQTCERDRRVAPGESTRGRRLGDAVAAALERVDADDRLALRRVSCLSGCPSPCNVALRGQRKTALRFSRLCEEDAQAIVDFALRYAESATGEVPGEAWPDGLAERLTVRVPPP